MSDLSGPGRYLNPFPSDRKMHSIALDRCEDSTMDDTALGEGGHMDLSLYQSWQEGVLVDLQTAERSES